MSNYTFFDEKGNKLSDGKDDFTYAVIFSQNDLEQFRLYCVTNDLVDDMTTKLNNAVMFPIVIHFNVNLDIWDISENYPYKIEEYLIGKAKETVGWFINFGEIQLNTNPMSKDEMLAAIEHFTTSPTFSNINSITIHH